MSLSVWELNPKPSINDSYIKDTERSDICSSIKKETSHGKPKREQLLSMQTPRHKRLLNIGKKLQ